MELGRLNMMVRDSYSVLDIDRKVVDEGRLPAWPLTDYHLVSFAVLALLAQPNSTQPNSTQPSHHISTHSSSSANS